MSEWWGGACDFKYEHEKYWPALVGMCVERKKEQMERWRALGGTVGLREWDLKGGGGADKADGEAKVEEAVGKVGEAELAKEAGV